MKKKVLVTAGGTAAAWHLISVIETHFSQDVELFICDINPPWLIPGSRRCTLYFQVPPISEPGYYDHMLNLLASHDIEIVVPLIDEDIALFPEDNSDLRSLGVRSTAPAARVCERITDKVAMYDWIRSIGVAVPRQFEWNELEPDREYFIKPERGFGSRGVIRLKGRSIRECPEYANGFIVQELCHAPEVTMEIFSDRSCLLALCRERVETRCGVCTKARFFRDHELEGLAGKIASKVELPAASCVQFMRGSNEKWCLTDFNLRLGAGTALSSAAGFELARAALCSWLGRGRDSLQHLRMPERETFAVRVYQEILMK